MIRLDRYNENPKGRKTGDCVTRALTTVCEIPYVDALRLQFETASKRFFGICDKGTYEPILKQFGFIKMAQPRKADNTKYTVGELDDILTDRQMEKGVFIRIAGHCTCIKNGVLVDTWDCRDYTVGNYYVKM